LDLIFIHLIVTEPPSFDLSSKDLGSEKKDHEQILQDCLGSPR
jgi:23S rRNA G2069 N7-methylase RlmK/C1962 C5-methylase RlmI